MNKKGNTWHNDFKKNIIDDKCFESLSTDQYWRKPILKLTNKEAPTVLYSVTKHAGSGDSTKEVKVEARAAGECFSLLLKYYRPLFCVLLQTEQSKVEASLFVLW